VPIFPLLAMEKSFRVRRPDGEFFRIGATTLQQLKDCVLNKKDFGLNGKHADELRFKEEDGTNVDDDGFKYLKDETKLFVLLTQEKLKAPPTSTGNEEFQALKRKIMEMEEKETKNEVKIRRLENITTMTSLTSSSHVEVYNRAVEAEHLKVNRLSCLNGLPLMDPLFVEIVWNTLKDTKLPSGVSFEERAVQKMMDKIFRRLITERDKNSTSRFSNFKYKPGVVLMGRTKVLDGTIFYEGDYETWSTLLLGIEYEGTETTHK